MEKKDKLSLRETRLIKGLAEGLTPTEAARRAGYADSTIDKTLKSVIGKNRVQAAIADLMDEAGLTREKLLEKLGEGLESTKVISANVVASNGEGMKEANGLTKDFIDVPDFATRHKYLETALELRGEKDKSKTVSVSAGDQTITVKWED